MRLIVGVVVLGAGACSSSLGSGPGGGKDADPAAVPDAARDAGAADGGGRGSGTYGDSCAKNLDCACGYYCLGAASGDGFCIKTAHNLPCAENCDCPDEGYNCSPNEGYPVCKPVDAGVCVQSSCNASHPCCQGICCPNLSPSANGVCDGLC